MAEPATEPEAWPQRSGGRARRRRRLVTLLVVLLGVLLVAPPLALYTLTQTPAGRSFVAERIARIEPRSGLRISVGTIEGSLLSRFVLRDLVLSDLDGPFLRAPEVAVDWNPRTILGGTIDVRRALAPLVELDRLPRLNPGDPDAPLLPQVDILVGRADVLQLRLGEGVAGRAETLRVALEGEIVAQRARVRAGARGASGDWLRLVLDAEPERDRLDLGARLMAPAGGWAVSLAGLDRSLDVALGGAGTWSAWRGRLAADLGPNGAAGAQRLASLGVRFESGRLAVAGEAAPGLVLEGEAAQRLLGPRLAVDFRGERQGAAFDARLSARSPALALDGSARLSDDGGRLLGARALVMVNDAGALAHQLSARRLSATLDAAGPIRRPAARWAARAEGLAWRAEARTLGAARLAADGRLDWPERAGPPSVPFRIRAEGLSGLPAEAMRLLGAPTLSGVIELGERAIRGRELALVGADVRARGAFLAMPDFRRWALDGNAEIARYRLPQIGTARLSSRLRVASAPGALAVDGRATARLLSLDSEAARNLFQGLPVVDLGFATGADGIVRVSDGRLTSPGLILARARGAFDPASGRFSLATEGVSRAYGPLALAAEGTPSAPTATLRLASPGLGLGLRDVVARLTPGEPQGFRIEASGDSPRGPLAADVRLVPANGQPLTLEIRRLAYATLAARGRLVQTPAGPFAGLLEVVGQGLAGTAALSAEGAFQRAQLAFRARRAQLPLAGAPRIGEGRLAADLILADGGPRVTGEWALADVRYGGWRLSRAAGRAALSEGAGRGVLAVSGTTPQGQPLEARATLASVAEGYVLGLDGRVGRLPLRLSEPGARLVRVAGGWELRPTRLVLPRGQLAVAGRLAADRRLEFVARDVDLDIVQLIDPSIVLTGRLNGRASLAQPSAAALPVGQLSAEVSGFSRTGLAGPSPRVDLALAGTSRAEGVGLGVGINAQGRELGRAVVRVAPAATGTATGTGIERLLRGALGGGVRYNGPVQPLWAFAALAGQDLAGGIVIGADFAGTLAQPQLAGVVRGRGLTYSYLSTNTQISDIALEGRFAGPRFELISLTGRANGGTLSGSGTVVLGEGNARQVALDAQLTNARLAASDTLRLAASGPLRLRGQGNRLTLSGELGLTDGYVRIGGGAAGEVPVVAVRRAGAAPVEQGQAPAPSIITLDVAVRTIADIRVEGLGLDSEWRADIRLAGTPSDPRILGAATLYRGEFSFAGAGFDVTRGRIDFNGRPLESSLAIAAQTVAEGITAQVDISGTAERPQIVLSSTPDLPQDEILARLLFGASVADLSVTEAVQLATAVVALSGGGGGGLDPIGQLRRAAGFDRLRIQGGDEATGLGTAIAIGRRLSRSLYVEVATDTEGNAVTIVQLSLTRALALLAQLSTIGRNRADFRYQRDY